MKKFATILVLLFVLSISTFAEGEFPIGNRTCPQGQTCLVDGEIPIGNITEDTVFKNIFDFLKSIF
jgi:hypothetical protein